MFRKLLLSSISVGAMVAIAATNSYHVQIYQDSVIAGKSIKAGDYKIEMQNNKAVLTKGKQTIEVPAHAETGAKKFSSTEMEYRDKTIQQIRVGGSKTKIIFDGANATAGGAE
jgi:hypothetical protein